MVLIEIILTKFLFFAGIITNSTSANTLSHLNLGLTIVLSVIVYTLISVKFFREFLQRMINFFLDNKPITNVIYLIFITIAILTLFYINTWINRQ